MNLQPAWSVCGLNHFIDAGGTEILAGVAVFAHTTLVAHVGVVDNEMSRLVFLVLGARVVDVGQLIEGQFAITFCSVDDVAFCSSVRWELRELLHAPMAGMIAVMRPQ